MYYANLVGWIGCHADSHELSALFGDDIAFRADTYAVDMTGLPFLRLIMSHVRRGLPGWERGMRATAFLVTARSQVATLIQSHCSSAGVLSDRMGLDRQVGKALAYVFERWDGRGYPDGLAGEEIPLIARIVCACDAYSAMTTDRSYRKARSPEAALAELQRSAGTHFDPRVVDAIVRVELSGR